MEINPFSIFRRVANSSDEISLNQGQDERIVEASDGEGRSVPGRQADGGEEEKRPQEAQMIFF